MCVQHVHTKLNHCLDLGHCCRLVMRRVCCMSGLTAVRHSLVCLLPSSSWRAHHTLSSRWLRSGCIGTVASLRCCSPQVLREVHHLHQHSPVTLSRMMSSTAVPPTHVVTICYALSPAWPVMPCQRAHDWVWPAFSFVSVSWESDCCVVFAISTPLSLWQFVFSRLLHWKTFGHDIMLVVE